MGPHGPGDGSTSPASGLSIPLPVGAKPAYSMRTRKKQPGRPRGSTTTNRTAGPRVNLALSDAEYAVAATRARAEGHRTVQELIRALLFGSF